MNLDPHITAAIGVASLPAGEGEYAGGSGGIRVGSAVPVPADAHVIIIIRDYQMAAPAVMPF